MFDRIRRAVMGAKMGWRNASWSGSELARYLGGLNSFSDSGVKVTPDSAMQLSAVYACVRVLAETIASLPLHIYERKRSGSSRKQRAVNHPLYHILHDRPNPLMSSFEFRETLMAHLALRGNAYAEIQRDQGGRVVALWPWHPDKVRVELKGWNLTYYFRTQNYQEVKLKPEQVLHLRGLSSNGIMGLAPIEMAMDTIGVGLAANRYGARFFKNNATPSLVLKYPGKLSEKAVNNIRTSWEETYGGLEHSHRVSVLEEGMAIEKIGIEPEHAQFLETRKFQVNEIARIFRIPPHMIGDLERSTFSNVEQQSIDFTVHTVRPWLRRWEHAFYRSLLTEEERAVYFIEFMMDELMRGDAKTRWETYQIAFMNGILSRNEIRDRENMNPIDGGDRYYVPVNLQAVESDRPPSVDSDDETK